MKWKNVQFRIPGPKKALRGGGGEEGENKNHGKGESGKLSSCCENGNRTTARLDLSLVREEKGIR